MREMEFVDLNLVNRDELMAVLNEPKLREHLVEHAYFDADRFGSWINDKMETDSLPGCRVQAVCIDGVLAGWCGIQPDDKGFELAIVISPRFWGAGVSIFKTLLRWAEEFGHHEVMFHLLDSRREYRALEKMATRIETSELMGRSFTTYYIAVSDGD